MKITKELIDRCWENSVLAGKTEGITPDIAWMDFQCEICELYQAIKQDKRVKEEAGVSVYDKYEKRNYLRYKKYSGDVKEYRNFYKDTIEEELADCVIVLCVYCSLVDVDFVRELSGYSDIWINSIDDIYMILNDTMPFLNRSNHKVFMCKHIKTFDKINILAEYYGIDLEAEVNRKLEYNKLRYSK